MIMMEIENRTRAMYTYMYVNERCRRKKQARSYKQQSKAHNTPKAVTFPKKNELPHVHIILY